MATLLIRNLDESVRDALRVLAVLHGRSVEAEARAILAREAKAEQRINWNEVASVATGSTGPVTRDVVNSTYETPGE